MEQKRLGDIAAYINGYAFKPEDRGIYWQVFLIECLQDLGR